MTATTTSPVTLELHHQISQFLYHEAELLDDWRLEEWLQLYTEDAHYWVPIDESKPRTRNASLLNEDWLRLEERVYRLLHTPFPSQRPRSRTVHQITNIRVVPEGDFHRVRSTQSIHEMRTGDPSQVGLGEPRVLAAQVEHTLTPRDDSFAIRGKTILLLTRDVPIGNLTFLL